MRPHIKADGAAVPDLKHPPSYYLRTNMWVSTSGNYLPAAFDCTREALGIERIVLGTDHPYEEMNESLAFLSGLELSSSEADRALRRKRRRSGIRIGCAESRKGREP